MRVLVLVVAVLIFQVAFTSARPARKRKGKNNKDGEAENRNK